MQICLDTAATTRRFGTPPGNTRAFCPALIYLAAAVLPCSRSQRRLFHRCVASRPRMEGSAGVPKEILSAVPGARKTDLGLEVVFAAGGVVVSDGLLVDKNDVSDGGSGVEHGRGLVGYKVAKGRGGCAGAEGGRGRVGVGAVGVQSKGC